MKTQECGKCGVRKPLSEFYKHPNMASGHVTKCKDCFRAYSRANWAANREKRIAYDRARGPERGNRPRLDPYSREKAKENSRAWYQANKVKAHAKTALGRAVAAGKVKRLPCRECGNKKSQGHHEDYSKPLDVIWLCSLHHMRLHRAREAALK